MEDHGKLYAMYLFLKKKWLQIPKLFCEARGNSLEDEIFTCFQSVHMFYFSDKLCAKSIVLFLHEIFQLFFTLLPVKIFIGRDFKLKYIYKCLPE